VSALLQGYNVGIFGFGATGSGKTYTFEGSQTDQGVVSFFVEGLFGAISDKITVEY